MDLLIKITYGRAALYFDASNLFSVYQQRNKSVWCGSVIGNSYFIIR